MMKINWTNHYVRDFIHHAKKLDVKVLYELPEDEKTKKWLAETAALLKKIDSNDYLEFVKLSKRINPTIIRIKRQDTAHEIDNFVRMKAEEYPIQDIGDNYDPDHRWVITNPFWIIFQVIKFIIGFFVRYPVLSIIITILGLLGIDYSLAWKNLHFLIGLFLKQ